MKRRKHRGSRRFKPAKIGSKKLRARKTQGRKGFVWYDVPCRFAGCSKRFKDDKNRDEHEQEAHGGVKTKQSTFERFNDEVQSPES